VIAALGRSQPIASRLSQVDVTDAHVAVVLLDGDSALLHLGDDKFLERVQSYLELSPALRDRVTEIDYVDLRFDPRVYVQPAGERGRNSSPRR
jgi:cell division septal protein FtsQ